FGTTVFARARFFAHDEFGLVAIRFAVAKSRLASHSGSHGCPNSWMFCSRAVPTFAFFSAFNRISPSASTEALLHGMGSLKFQLRSGLTARRTILSPQLQILLYKNREYIPRYPLMLYVVCAALDPAIRPTRARLKPHTVAGLSAARVTGAFKASRMRIPSQSASDVRAACKVGMKLTCCIAIHGDPSSVDPDYRAFVV